MEETMLALTLVLSMISLFLFFVNLLQETHSLITSVLIVVVTQLMLILVVLICVIKYCDLPVEYVSHDTGQCVIVKASGKQVPCSSFDRHQRYTISYVK